MTTCITCDVKLASLSEVHAVRGSLYCSRECAIIDIFSDIIMNAKEAAIEEYECLAEVVSTADILKDEMCELVNNYNSEHDEEDYE